LVFVDEAAEQVSSSGRHRWSAGLVSDGGRRARVGRSEVEGAVRALLVVVADVDAEDVLELAAAEDE
jgi:hypothetical protein